MRINIATKVNLNYQKLFQKFDLDLFMALKPPLMPLEVSRFDGCETGDQIHIILGKKPFSQSWISFITDHGNTEEECYFVDEGREQLPFFLKTWKHRHRILKTTDTTSTIIDDIQYTTPFFLFDYLLFPIMYFQFWLRKPIYKKLGKKN